MAPQSESSWLVFWFIVEAASIVCIAVGCLGEWLAEKFHFRHKPKTVFGAMVVCGLAVELLAFGFSFILSFREIEGLRSKNNELEARLVDEDPINQPISSIEADLSVKVKGADFIELPPYGTPAVAWIFLCVTNVNDLFQASEFSVLDADTFKRFRVNGDHGYTVRFNTSLLRSRDFASPMPSVRDALKQISCVKIDAKFIPHDSQVLGGTVQLLINGQFSKRFTILPQLAFESRDALSTNNNNAGFTMLATNTVAPDFTMRRAIEKGTVNLDYPP